MLSIWVRVRFLVVAVVMHGKPTSTYLAPFALAGEMLCDGEGPECRPDTCCHSSPPPVGGCDTQNTSPFALTPAESNGQVFAKGFGVV